MQRPHQKAHFQSNCYQLALTIHVQMDDGVEKRFGSHLDQADNSSDPTRSTGVAQ